MTRLGLRLILFCFSLAHGPGPSSVTGQERIVAVASTQLEHFSAPLKRTDLKLTGSASCSSAACHGGPRAGVLVDASPRGVEYPIWLATDPHGRSWRTMCGDASVKIMEKLGVMRDGRIIDSQGFDNCLACHNTTRRFSEPRSEQFHAEGVGCAACHGPSERWFGDHYRFPLGDLASADAGLVPTRNLLARARMCATCHVGDRDRDMNHDIIAAGHPALYYEFATFHNRLPKHWRETQKSASPEHEAQLWLAGQVAALDASLCLIEGRAEKLLPVSTWPEFANLDCSSCHQNLRLSAVNEAYGGVAQFSVWNRYGVELLLEQISEDGLSLPLAEALNDLDTHFSQASVPDRLRAGELASRVRYALDEWLQKSAAANIESFHAKELKQIVTMAQAETDTRWEALAQFYLAAVAARHSWNNDLPPTTFVEAVQLRQALLFKPGTSSLAILDQPPAKRADKSAERLRARLQITQASDGEVPHGK